MRITGFKSGGDLDFTGATLINPGRSTLDARDIAVAGRVYCANGFRSTGTVDFAGATVKSTLSFHGATLAGPEKWSLALWHATVATLDLRMAEAPEGPVNLRHTTLDVLRDDPASWPGAIVLDGPHYSAIEPAGLVGRRADWLRSEKEGFLTQPYEQLAAVYRQTGQDNEARLIRLAKQRERRKNLSRPARLWGQLQDAAVGYGYRPERAIGWLLGLLGVGDGRIRPLAADCGHH